MTQSLYRVLKQVRLREQVPDIAEKIEYDFSLSPLTSRILAARGFVPDQKLENYLVPTLRSGIPDPNTMKNLPEAADCIAHHAKEGSGVAIACDFDVDGLSGGSLLHHLLQSTGASSRVYVPDRFTEGYGLNDRIVHEAKSDGYQLLVTIDYGTTNIKELELARSLGLKTVVVDHHHVAEIPPADIFVNPHQDGCGFADGTLCAAGLVWFLAVLLSKRLEGIDPKNYLDIACLGTICDMVPLQGANRIIARRGLECLTDTKRPGLVALKQQLGVNGALSCSNVSFGIGPRLNAAGRMVNGEMVVELLTTSDSRKAEKLAKRLHKLNSERQDTEQQVKDAAVKQVLDKDSLPEGIVAWNKDFHTGVIGIVAQRLVEQFYRPSAVMGFEHGMYKGSVRGIKGMSVVELLSNLSRYLDKFGGHDGAGGFSLPEEHLEDFTKAFNEESEKLIQSVDKNPTVDADTECTLQELTPAIIRELKRFEPLGMGNPGPQLMLRELVVKDLKLLKNAHLKAFLSDGKQHIAGLLWRTTEHPSLKIGEKVNVVGKADINSFFGNSEVQMNLQAVEAAA